jgi:hypothetical protein
MHDETEWLLLKVNDAVLVLVILQFLIGQIRKTLHVFIPYAFPLLRQQYLFLCDHLPSSNGLGIYLDVGNIAGVGGTLEHDELGDATADCEYHLGIGDHQEK